VCVAVCWCVSTSVCWSLLMCECMCVGVCWCVSACVLEFVV